MYGVRRTALASALVCALGAASPVWAATKALHRSFAPNENSAESERHQQAEAQFDIAESMRQSLESNPENKATVEQYRRVVSAYRRVYLLTSTDKDVPPAIMAVGDLYRTMAERFDSKYWQSAVDAYQFLLHDYPASHLREDALWWVAEIQRTGLKNPALAQKNYEQFLQQHPHSSHASDARTALADLKRGDGVATPGASVAKNENPASDVKTSASAKTNSSSVSGSADARRQPVVVEASVTAPAPPAFTPTQISPSERMEAPTGDKTAMLTEVKTWNTPDYTRLEILLTGAIKYQAARIEDPPRIYFDISKARLTSQMLHAQIPVQGELLKGIRVAQNQDGVVRVVIEISKVRDYAVYLLRDPYRMVVDVYPKADRLTAQNQWNAKPNQAARGTKNPFEPPKQLALTTAQREKAADAILASTQQAQPQPPPQQAQPQPPPPQAQTQQASAHDSDSTKSVAQPETAKPVAEIKTVRNAKLTPPPVAEPNLDGSRSLTRALGLKIGRIVIDAGHGGHDTGTVGPSGLMEKDLCLDIALRLGKMIEAKLPGADVIYTRTDDTFIPLEQRTQIANDAKADLFISIHANSSPDHSARGVETYYLNFAASPGAMEVAARENALAQQNIHDLEDIVQRITRNEKIEESKDFASDIQTSLSARLRKSSPAIRDRGVHRAPFVVLIGANMPSVLAEISFISNPTDEALLKKGDNRERVAEGLYRGVEAYLQSVNSLASNQTKPLQQQASAGSTRASASPGNQR